MKSTRGTLVGLDIGTTKTCVVVAVTTPRGLDVIGVGEAPSNGLRRGIVTDLEETVHSIETATERAERMAGVQIAQVYVGVTGEHMQSTNNRGVVAISGVEREVAPGDVRRVVEASKLIQVGGERQIVHALPRYYTIDGHDGIVDPVGLSGGRLEVETHIVTGGAAFITNVLKCVRRAGLEAAGVVFEPLASSAATLSNEEKQLGVALLDIGGGTTDIAVFGGGGAVYTGTIPVGGNMLTNDIAFGLKTSFAEAERVKRESASLRERSEGEDPFAVISLDGRTTQLVTRAQLRAIVEPRVAEIFKIARAQIGEHAPRELTLAEIVVTGGGARLDGLDAFAATFFGVPARVGVPTAIGGLSDAYKQPEYATAVGLVLAGPKGEQAAANARPRGGLARMTNWFGELWN